MDDQDLGWGGPDGDDDVFLRPGDAIEFDGKLLVIQRRCRKPKGYVVADATTVAEEVMLSRDIKCWHRAGRLFFVTQSELGLPIGVRENLRRSLRGFAAPERREILRRLRYCRALDRLGPDFSRSEAVLQPVCDHIAAARNDTGPHDWYTVCYRYWLIWRRAKRDPRALCPSTRRRGNRTRRVEDYELTAMAEAIDAEWLRRRRPSMATAYKDCVDRCIKAVGGPDKALAMERPWPSLKTFRAECRRRGRVVRLARRHGPDAARQEMYPVGAGPDVRLPFERVEADFKYLRLFVVDDRTGHPLGTPYLMAAIDCYSGCIAGWDIGFDPPSYVSAARCLKHIIGFKDLSGFPKDEDGAPIVRRTLPVNGVPQQFFLDYDAVFHSGSFFFTARALGCHVDFIPPGQARKKGRIERFWRTVEQCFLDMFPGKVLRITDRPGRDYDPADDAVLTLSQLRLLITKAIVDVYHEETDEWSGKRRIDLWTEAVAVNPPRPVRSHSDLIELVGAYETRKAERRGIRLYGLRYNSPRLAEYRAGFEKDPRVEVRYDPQDISHVWVVDPDLPAPLRIPCTRPDYAEGLSLHQHRVIRRRASDKSPGGRLRMKELLIAKAELFALGKKMLGTKASRRGRIRVAQFLGMGRELIDQLTRRVHDPDQSAEAINLDDDGLVDDTDDEASARRDEAFVDQLQQERGMKPSGKPRGKIARTPKAEPPADASAPGAAAAPAKSLSAPANPPRQTTPGSTKPKVIYDD